MATKTSPQPVSSPPGRPAWIAPTFFALALLIVVVALTQLLGASSDKDRASFSAANAALGAIVPVLIAAVVGALIPRGQGWNVRFPLAVISALFAIFMMRMWPSSAAVVTEADLASPTTESGTILSWLIGLPLAGAIAILFLPRQSPRLLKATTFFVMIGTLFATIPLMRVDMGRTYHFNQDIVWIERFGIHYHVALDGISLWLVILTAFIVPIAAYASFGSVSTRIKDWCFALLLLEAAMIGAFVALDLFLFYVFWELMLIPMYVMIGVWGGTNRIKASLKFFLYTMTGSMLMLAAILYLAYTYGRVTGGPTSFDYFELQRIVLPRNIQIYLFCGFAASFLIKVPMFPVHTWLPDAHTEAPTAGSIILAAVMLKMGTYGYLRFCMGLFPEASSELAATLAGVAVLGGILYGGFCAWRQDDVKRLVAYSSVAHLGYVMLGMFALNPVGITGSIIQQLNHGISTGGLFLLVGVVYERRHTREISEYGGLSKVMPVYAAIFLIMTMSSIGLPSLNGFIGEFLILQGVFVANKVWAAFAGSGVVLGAAYMLYLYQRTMFGKIENPKNENLPDLNMREFATFVPLMILAVWIGLYPAPFLRRLETSVNRVVARVNPEYQAGRTASLAECESSRPVVSMVARVIGTPCGAGPAVTKAASAGEREGGQH